MRPSTIQTSIRRTVGLVAIVGVLAACSDDALRIPSDGGGVPEPTPRARVVLSVSPASGVADGATPVTVTADVRDAQGNAAADGTPITFTTSVGAFLETTTTTAVLSTTGGAAVVRVVASVVGTAAIRAEALGVLGSASVVFADPDSSTGGGGTTDSTDGGGGSGAGGVGTAVDFTGTLFLQVDNPVVPTGFGGSQANNVSIFGRAKNLDNTPYAGGGAVTWTVVGPGAIAPADWGFVPSQSDTSIDGEFTGVYTAAEVEGNYTVTAWLGSASKSVVIQVIDLSPSSILVSASPSGLNADGSSQSTISITVLDQTGSAVADNTQVNANIVSGGGTLDKTIDTTSGGKVTLVYTAGTVGGVATIRAAAGTVSDTVAIALTSLNPQDVNVTVAPTTVELSAAAGVTATVLDGNNQPVPAGSNITFSFGTVPPGGDAVLTPTQAATNEQGRAAVQFSAGTVTGTYAIVADAGNGVTDYATVSVVTPGVGSIQFVAAIPPVIGVKGSDNGGNSALPELSNLTFSVITTSGKAVSDGTLVTFTLQGPFGTTLITSSAQTIDGIATARIRSGTVSGLVRVNARTTFGGQTFTASSSNVVVQAGPPAAEHVSISLANADWVLPGMSVDGLDICYTIIMGDRFNNPVPDGTVVFFTGEGGVIGEGGQASAQTNNGVASICGVTANPRPMPVVDAVAAAAQVNFFNVLPAGITGHGWGTIQFSWQNRIVDFLAQVLGEEAFIDVNGNGLRDTGETFADLGEPFVDLNFAFAGHTHDGVIPLFGGTFAQAIEPFWDTVTADGQYNIGNGAYDAAITIGAHGPQSVWTNQAFSVQYAPSQFIDANNDTIYDPGGDIPVVAGPGVTATAAVTICTQNALNDPTLLRGGVGGFANGFLQIDFWAGDAAGVSPFNGGTVSFGSDGNIDVLTDSIALGDGAAAVALTGLRIPVAMTVNNETAAPEIFSSVSIKYPNVEAVATQVEVIVGVCVATIEQ